MGKQAIALTRDEGTRLAVLGTEVRFLCQAAETDRTFSLMEVVLPENAGPPPHDHPWDEAYYVIEGDVRFLVGEETRVFSKGDFIYAPGGVLHSFIGASPDPARVLVFDTPATAEGFFRDVDREVRSEEDLGRIPEIALRYDLRFQPPA